MAQTISLSFRQFEEAFGFNPTRTTMLRPLLLTLQLFHKYGCHEVYIAGSYTTSKVKPGDIDVCVDMTYMDIITFRKARPEFFTRQGQNEYKKTHKIDVACWFTS